MCKDKWRKCRDYIAGLLRYLEDFFKRTQPLQILAKVYKDLDSFDEEFESGKCPGWEDKGEGIQVSDDKGTIDLDAFASVEELLTLGEWAHHLRIRTTGLSLLPLILSKGVYLS